jgi:hypothetical protein
MAASASRQEAELPALAAIKREAACKRFWVEALKDDGTAMPALVVIRSVWLKVINADQLDIGVRFGLANG